MKLLSKSVGRLPVWLLALLALSLALPVQGRSVSDAQMEQFQNLPRAQQESLAREYGVDLDDLDRTGNPRQQQRPRDVQVVDTPLSDPRRQVDDDDDTLKPFGYDLFAGRPTTFAPVTEIPLPSEYIVGPGDVVRLQLFGKENELLELPVSRDGVINMPETGPIAVAGLTFADLKERLNEQVRQRYIGTQASVSMGELRSMRVFVLGEASSPGSYTVSSLSTMTNALFVSGGIEKGGSLRNVQLKRGGEVIGTLDLYDLLLTGDTSGDLRLQSGDALFIPAVGDTVSVDGEVRRPAIYELRDGETLADLIDMAGGYTTDAAPAHTTVERVQERRQRALESVDLTRPDGRSFRVRDGDYVTIKALNDLTEGFVRVEGAALRTGNQEWREGMRVSDLLSDRRSDLKPDTDLGYALIVREADQAGGLSVKQFSPASVLRQPGGDEDLRLQERDQLLFFSRKAPSEATDGAEAGTLERRTLQRAEEGRVETEQGGRRALLKPVLERLSIQASPEDPMQVVTVEGAVRYPGDYPLPDNASASDLIAAAGGLKDSALMLEAEVTRVRVTEAGQTDTELHSFPLFAGVDSGSDAITLERRDRLLIKAVPGFAEREVIRLEGEVRFPGQYSIRAGDSLADVIERAGGLTERAFPEGALFTRERLRRLERERLEDAEQRLRRDLVGLQLDAGEQASPQDLGMLQGLLQEVQSAEPTGRLVIDLERLLAGNGRDLEVLNGDRLNVPRRPDSVSVFGEVQFSSSHLYDRRLTVSDYLDRSGGLTSQADRERIYVVRADGSVWRPESSRWFAGRGEELRPGDTIVAPIDVDRINQLQLWTNVSQVFSNLAVSAAALRSF